MATLGQNIRTYGGTHLKKRNAFLPSRWPILAIFVDLIIIGTLQFLNWKQSRSMRHRSVDISAIAVLVTVGAIFIFHQQQKQQQTKQLPPQIDSSRRRCAEETDECHSSSFSSEEMPRLASLSELMAFLEPLKLGASVEEANKRRSILYHALATDDGSITVSLGQVMKDTSAKRGGSQRAAIIMCDQDTSQMLQLARNEILKDMDTSDDYLLRNFHVTLFSITSPSNDQESMSTLVNRSHTKVQPFQLELDRFVVVGDMIVALWRTVGEHTANEAAISDRHGNGNDSFVQLLHDLDDLIGEKPNLEDCTQDTVLQLGCLYHGWIFTVIAQLPSSNTAVQTACLKASAKYCGHSWIASHVRLLKADEVIFDETLPLERDYLDGQRPVDANKSFDTHETETSISIDEESVATTSSRRGLRVPKWFRRDNERKNKSPSTRRSWLRRRSKTSVSTSGSLE